MRHLNQVLNLELFITDVKQPLMTNHHAGLNTPIFISGMDGEATEGGEGASDSNASTAEQELEGEKPQEPETATV